MLSLNLLVQTPSVILQHVPFSGTIELGPLKNGN